MRAWQATGNDLLLALNKLHLRPEHKNKTGGRPSVCWLLICHRRLSLECAGALMLILAFTGDVIVLVGLCRNLHNWKNIVRAPKRGTNVALRLSTCRRLQAFLKRFPRFFPVLFFVLFILRGESRCKTSVPSWAEEKKWFGKAAKKIYE